MDRFIKAFVGIGIFLFLLSLAYPFVIHHYFPKWEDSALFGDTFGALNSVFSGLAFLGIIVTILIQRNELEQQRVELSLQREEMKQTREEFQINRITNIVYNQLERYEAVLNGFSIEIADGSKSVSGINAFFLLRTELEPLEAFKVENPPTGAEKSKLISTAMGSLLKDQESLLRFSLSLYNVVEGVKKVLVTSDLPPEELESLKDVFFNNIGIISLDVFDNVNIAVREFYSLNQSNEKVTSNYYMLGEAASYINTIMKFRRVTLTEENIRKIRKGFFYL